MNKDITNGKELIVRKKAASFIEKMFRYFNYDFRHDVYKKIVCSETGYATPLEEKLKNYYDAYIYLLNNHKSPLSRTVLSKFFYLLYGKEVNQSMLLKLVNLNFELYQLGGLEYVIEFHIGAYKIIEMLDEEDRFIISLMFFNYSLLKINVPIIHFVYPKLIEYEKVKKEYLSGDKKGMFNFILDILVNFKFQDKSYYKKLRRLSALEICKRIKEDQTMLETKYHIKNVYLFGSFAKNLERIDSDIDLLLVFHNGITSEMKRQSIDKLSEYYFDVFDRFIDIIHINSYIDDEFLRELNGIEKII